MNDQPVDLRAAILNLDSLPTMPIMAQKILALPLDTVDGEARLLRLIVQDPQISARIIGLANSPLFGASRKVTSITDAAMMLGITRIKSVSVGIAVLSALTRRPASQLNIQNLWIHSVGIAQAMSTLAQAMPGGARPLDDEVFFAGLLHDIGFMVLNYIDPKRSNLLQSRLADEPDRPITEIEAETIEIGHSELGAELARHWDLPESIVAVLRHHHDPCRTGGTSGQLIALLGVAEKLLPAFGIPEHVASGISTQDWLNLGIDPARAEELTRAVHDQAEQARHIAKTF